MAAHRRGGDLFEDDPRPAHALDALEARHAAARELLQRQSRALPQACLVVCVLERPDPRSQPLEKRQVLGLTAEEGLAQVHVPLHEARTDRSAREFDERFAGSGLERAEPRDARALDPQVAAAGRCAGHHRQERGAAQQQAQRSCSWIFTSSCELRSVLPARAIGQPKKLSGSPSIGGLRVRSRPREIRMRSASTPPK